MKNSRVGWTSSFPTLFHPANYFKLSIFNILHVWLGTCRDGKGMDKFFSIPASMILFDFHYERSVLVEDVDFSTPGRSI